MRGRRHAGRSGAGAGRAASRSTSAAGVGSRALASAVAGRSALSDDVVRSVGAQAGNRAAAELVQRERAGATRDDPNAAARQAVATQLPHVLPLLSQSNLAQIQKFIDAATQDPAARERAEELDRQANKRYGSLVVRDRKLAREAERAWRKVIRTRDSERRIRLDETTLLAPDVFTPQKGDPDELAFIDALRSRLARTGIWLRIGDGVPPELWLSFGPNGDHVPSAGGKVSRAHILETTTLGAMYHRLIYQSARHRTLDRELDELGSYLMDGLDEYHRQAGVRATAAPGVVAVSDFLGDADFPPETSWESPWRIYIEARKAWAKRDLEMAHTLALLAGYLGTVAGDQLIAYVDATVNGASIAVTWLQRTKRVAQVVETVAGMYLGGAWVLRAARGAGGAVAGAEAAGGAVEITSARSSWARSMERFMAEHPAFHAEVRSIENLKGAGQVTRPLWRKLGNLGMGKFL